MAEPFLHTWRARCTRRQKALTRVLVASFLALGLLAAPIVRASDFIDCSTGIATDTMPLFDFHNHLRVASAEDAEDALDTLAAEGVSLGMLALGTLEEDELDIAIGLQTSSTYTIFALVNPPHSDDGFGNKTFDSTSFDYVVAKLNAGASGIGELILRHSGPPALSANVPADQTIAMDFYAEAAERGVPVSFHFETRDKTDPSTDIASRIQELRNAISANPDTIFIWSHAGDTGPSTIRSFLEDYANLYVDLSTRNPHFVRGWPVGLQSLSSGADGTGPLKSQWKDLFTDHPDRFMFGLDLASGDRWDQVSLVVSYYRDVLKQLPQETAEKIACKNARAVLLSNSVPATSAPLVILLVALLASAGVGSFRRARARS